MADISRRTFIQLSVVAGAAAAGVSGCKNEQIYKEEVTGQYGGYNAKAFPYVNQPDGMIDGVPQYFATTCQMCPAGCGLYVRTIGGRANKVEGNPDHPVNSGRTCMRGQLSLQHLYNPDRIRFPAERRSRQDEPQTIQWDAAINRTVAALSGSRGRTAVLVDQMTVGRSPSQMSMVREFAAVFGAEVTLYSLLDDSPWRIAASRVYGRPELPAYQIDQADLLISFGGNFLEAWPSPVYYSKLFGEFRQGVRRTPGQHGRFVYIGPRMSMTAAKADLWLPCNPGTERSVAQGMLTAMGGEGIPVAEAAAVSGLTVAQITDLATQFMTAGPRACAVGGDGLYSDPQPDQAFTAVELLNVRAKSQCVSYGEPLFALAQPTGNYAGMTTLIQKMKSGAIRSLFIVGQPNPMFTLPAAADWAQAVSGVPFVASLTSFEDETAVAADVLLPTLTFLEDWSDNIPAVLPPKFQAGSIRQPIIDPQFITTRHHIDENNQPVSWMDAHPLADVLIELIRRSGKASSAGDSRELVRRTWASKGFADAKAAVVDNDGKWTQLLGDGGAWKALPPARVYGRATSTLALPETGGDGFALLLFPHLYFGDGRHANLDWVQEMPDPMTAAVWNSWVEINVETAQSMGIRTGDLVRLTSPYGSIDVHAVPYPAIHPGALAMPIGQGHDSFGRYASGTGSNPLSILNPDAHSEGVLAYSATRVQLKKISDAQTGYDPDLKTLVLVQDRPNGAEPDAVKDLIHESAREFRQSQLKTAAPA